jgi:hypothetical protein
VLNFTSAAADPAGAISIVSFSVTVFSVVLFSVVIFSDVVFSEVMRAGVLGSAGSVDQMSAADSNAAVPGLTGLVMLRGASLIQAMLIQTMSMASFPLISRNHIVATKMTRGNAVRQRRARLRTGYAELSGSTVLIPQRGMSRPRLPAPEGESMLTPAARFPRIFA